MNRINVTGQHQTTVRQCFADSETYGFGYMFCATGNLDAPDSYPQGSMRQHDTCKPTVNCSVGHRDGQNRPQGECHDGQESAQNVRNWAK